MSLYPLKGVIQHYAWGGKKFLPNLLRMENTDNQAFAEFWMGTHHRGTAIIEDTGRLLSDLIATQPAKALGEKVAQKFGHRLPYLFKVLDVQKMLSIQAHPTKKAAEMGFQLENERGIPLTAFHRNYKDDNHKPEVMVAFSDFWLLHGFQSIEGIKKILDDTPEFRLLKAHFVNENIFELYKAIMEMPQEEIDAFLTPLAKRLINEKPQNKNLPDYWAALAFQDYTKNGHYDRGIFSIYLFNLVKIKKGEGIYQAAGVPHAYLEGINMELMANSDNVFRGGLTSKHIDVSELLQHLIFEPVTPQLLQAQPISDLESVYPTPSADFQLSRLEIKASQTYEYTATAAEIIIVMEGEIAAKTLDKSFERQKGEVVFVEANTTYQFYAPTKALLFKATVGFENKE